MASSSLKREFLAVYDYGMGGTWFIFLARSAQEVEAKYPMFEVVKTRPFSMTEEVYSRIRAHGVFDVDEEPKGLLKMFLDARASMGR